MAGISREATGTKVKCPICAEDIEADAYVLHSERHDEAGDKRPEPEPAE